MYTLRGETLAEETFASGKIREIFGINFRQLAVFTFLARINFREFMIKMNFVFVSKGSTLFLTSKTITIKYF